MYLLVFRNTACLALTLRCKMAPYFTAVLIKLYCLTDEKKDRTDLLHSDKQTRSLCFFEQQQYSLPALERDHRPQWAECYVIIQSRERNALPWRLQTPGPQTEQGLEVKWYPEQTGVYVRGKAPGGSPFKALRHPTPSSAEIQPNLRQPDNLQTSTAEVPALEGHFPRGCNDTKREKMNEKELENVHMLSVLQLDFCEFSTVQWVVYSRAAC